MGLNPGKEENKTGKPFCGSSGKLLDKWIEYLGLTDEDYAIVNIIKCYTPNQSSLKGNEAKNCLPFLKEQINILKPEYIITLGTIPTRELIGNINGITSVAGQLFKDKYIPLPHPSYYLRQGEQGWEGLLDEVKKIIDPRLNSIREDDTPHKQVHEKPASQEYVPLHLHTIYSITDSVIKIGELVDFAVENGFSSLGITDHGTISGWWEFQNLCQDKNIHPILGIEFYVAPFFGDKSSIRYHLVAYAKNQIGIKNIFKLIDFSYRDCFYQRPRITMEKLYKHKEGLIITTACSIGVIALRINEGKIGEGEKVLLELQKKFKDDLYIELQIHDFPEQHKANSILIEFAKKHSIKTIITTDAHYLLASDIKIHKALKAISYNQSFENAGFNIDTNYVMIDKDLIKHGLDINLPKQIILDSMKNTFEIAEKCKGILKPYKDALPNFGIAEDPFENCTTEIIG